VKKHHCGFEGTNEMMFKWKKRPSPQCPKCQEIETYRHIVRCQSRAATQAFQDTRTAFDQWLQETTSPGIKAAVMAHVMAYREGTEAETADNWTPELKETSETQIKIGPNAFFEGCITYKWEKIQRVHLIAVRSKRSPARWTRELIKKLWLISWDMWANRNGWIHNEKRVKEQQISKQLNEEIRTVRENGLANRFLPRLERAIFRQSLEELQQQTDYQKRVWIHTAEKIIERDSRRVEENRSVRILRGFFTASNTTQYRHST
jgi:hypothetical protein